MGKKGKKSKKKGNGDEGDGENGGGGGKAQKEEALSVVESILSFQMEVKSKTIQAFQEEIIQLKVENELCKEKTQKSQTEQLHYVKQSMKAARDYDQDHQNTVAELQSRIDDALKEKQDHQHELQIEQNKLKEECDASQKRIDEVLREISELQDYKENGSVLHKTKIDVLKCTISDLNASFDENSEYIQKNLRLTLDEISKATASKVDSQKYQATDRAIQLLDPRNYTVAQQNSWLKSEVNMLRGDIERLWSEVEKLETDNIFMLTDMYDERMVDIKRSRQHYVDCVKRGTTFGDRTSLELNIEDADELSDEETEDDEGEGDEDIGLTEAELQLLSIQGTRKPLLERPPDVDTDDSCLVAVSSFEWTLQDRATISLTTL